MAAVRPRGCGQWDNVPQLVLLVGLTTLEPFDGAQVAQAAVQHARCPAEARVDRVAESKRCECDVRENVVGQALAQEEVPECARR